MRDPAMPPLSFLLEASMGSLQDLELAALNRSSNLGKAAKEEIQQWIEQSAVAMLARWMMSNRDALREALQATEIQEVTDIFEALRQKKSA